MDQLDACYSGQASNFKCLHSNKSIEIASQILKEKETEYTESNKLKFDCFFKEDNKSGEITHDFSLKYIEGYTPLKPGDILYYPCANGKVGKFLGIEHASIYIGNGACIHLWQDAGQARIIITSVKLACSSICKLYALDISKITFMKFHDRIGIIREAVKALKETDSKGGTHGNYNALSNNCHQWVLDVASVRDITQIHNRLHSRCLPFNLHIKKSKKLAEKRKEEADKQAIEDAKDAHKKMTTMANRSSFKQFIK